MGIIVQGLNISFGEKRVFSNFDLSIEQGEFVCLLGKSGCGKTVLLNSILGNQKIDSGRILVGGKEVRSPSKLIAAAYQDFFILPWLTIRENIKLSGCSEEQLQSVCSMMHLEDHLNSFPNRVSIGTKQRASIARALAIQSEFLLMDEPLCSVDSITADAIRTDVRNVCQGKTVLYITHDISEAMKMASRIVCLGDGNKITLDERQEDTNAQAIKFALDK